jgi:hypothetical protein
MEEQEKKEYIENLFEIILTGGEENFELADTLIKSLELDIDFRKHTNKETRILRKEISLIEIEIFDFFKKRPDDMDFKTFDFELSKMTIKVEELREKEMLINSFCVFYYFKEKRKKKGVNFRFLKNLKSPV